MAEGKGQTATYINETLTFSYFFSFSSLSSLIIPLLTLSSFFPTLLLYHIASSLISSPVAFDWLSTHSLVGHAHIHTHCPSGLYCCSVCSDLQGKCLVIILLHMLGKLIL